jgi:hypothetical protein
LEPDGEGSAPTSPSELLMSRMGIDAMHVRGLRKKRSKILVEEAIAGIKALAIMLKPFQALAKGFFDLLPCEPIGLVKQWEAPVLTTELI